MPVFRDFEAREIPTSRGNLRAMIGGDGPPVLLLHGYPQTHLMWHAVAPLLADSHTVIATDLAGYGDSFRPTPAPDHQPHSKRAMALDQVEAMTHLGFDRFAYRMTLDHPDRVERLAVLDIVPTAEVWRRADAALARTYWHWSFLAQPAPLPERLIAADPQAYFDLHVRGGLGLGAEPGRYPAEIMDTYRELLNDPILVQALCEDYRAGASIDVEHDDADLAANRRIDCPVLVLWGTRGALPRLYGDVIEVWRPWAPDVRGAAINGSHFLAEDRPQDTGAALLAFFASS
jgi:haloacetate dehalogenase